MNLNELRQPTISRNTTAAAKNTLSKNSVSQRDGVSELKKLGWNRLSQNMGKYSSVYVNPKKNYVLKVMENHDLGYIAYVNLIHSMNNIHAPRISDMKELNINGVIHGIYLIEKLYPLSIDAFRIGEACSKVARYHEFRLKDCFTGYDDGIPEFLRDTPSLVELLRKIGEHYSPENGINLDIHELNIMTRQDGTLVVTDPYSGQLSSFY